MFLLVFAGVRGRHLLVCFDGPRGHVEYAKLDRCRDALYSGLVKLVPLVKAHT